jgi:hypothetical protein
MFLKPDNIKPAVKPGAPGQPAPAPAAAAYSEWKRWTTSEGKTFIAALVDKTTTQATFRLQDGKNYPCPLDKLADKRSRYRREMGQA